MNYEEFQTQDRRLVLLKALEGATQYRANAYLLRTFCDHFGHTVSSDRIEQDVAWLAEQGLLKSASVDGVTIATLTARGLDVAQGRATVPGVKKPAPGA